MLTSLLCSVPAGGPPVPVHPRLQGVVQAGVGAVVARGMAESGREGFLREDHRPLLAEERHRVRGQSSTVLQRVPGNGQ